MRMSRLGVVLFAALGTVAAAGCSGGGGGGGGGGPVPVMSASPSPILVAGSVRTYTGTDSIVHVYATQSPTANFTEQYTFTQTSTVNNSNTGAPAPFDIHVVAAYTTVQPPLTGNGKVSTTSDTYENQAASGSSEVVTEAGSATVNAFNDITADNDGGGPYTLTTTTTTNYNSPETTGTYPLVAGTTYTQPIARTVAVTNQFAGGATPGTYTYASNENTTYNSDGSYTRTQQNANGQSFTYTMASNGTATENETGSLLTFSENIGAPSGGAIPVTTTSQTPTQSSPTTKTYSAVDWYPGGGAAQLPFDVVTVSVKGPATSLPSGCTGAATEPNVVEVDQNETSLSLFGSLAVTQQQKFDSNGISVCILRTITTTNYSVETGLQTEQSTENYAQILTGVTTSSKLRSANVQR